MTRNALLGIPLLLSALPAAALDLVPASNVIAAVTVYTGRAQVTRQLRLDLPAGTHTLIVAGLPPRLLEQSLQVRGQGDGRLLVGSVEARRVYSTQLAQDKEQKLAASLRSLLDEKAQLDGRGQALDTQAAFIERLVHQPNDGSKDNTIPLPPDKWPAALQAIGNGMLEINKSRVALQKEQRELGERITKTEQELEQIHSGRKDSVSAVVQIEAAQATTARLELIYQVPGATWTPVYDARLITEQRTLQLTQAAWVRQNSGEDWHNVTLTVSTARPTANAAMPELYPWWIDFPRRIAPRASPMAEMKAEERELDAAAPAALRDAEEYVADEQVSEFTVNYRIPGAVDVTADNSQQRFVLAKQDIGVQLGARTTPRLDPRAYLYATFDYSGTAPLLSGTWRLSRDDTYIGEVAQEALRPGANVALAFGSDDAVEVQYHIVKNERSAQGVFTKEQQVARRYRFEVLNRHRIVVPVSIYDQLPVARDEQIKVTLDEDTTPPSARDVDERTGVLVWQYELKPQGKKVVDFGYHVGFPQGREVPGF